MRNLFSPQITHNTTFIVFDLEWNQPYHTMNYPFDTHKFNGEIIEIGAVKLGFDESGNLRIIDKLSLDIKPEYFKVLHYHVKKITHKSDADLKNGIKFVEAYDKLLKMCDEDSILVTWGNGDIDMLKLNLELLHCNTTIGKSYLDLQPLFSLLADEEFGQRSVEYAVDFFNITKSEDFHSAYADAYYTSLIMTNLCERYGIEKVMDLCTKSTIDPDVKHSYTRTTTPDKNISHAYEDKEKWNKICPLCNGKNKAIISMFRIQKSAYALYECKEHGKFFVRNKVKKNKDGLYYGSIVKRMCTIRDFVFIEDKKKEYDVYGKDGKPQCLREKEQIVTEKI